MPRRKPAKICRSASRRWRSLWSGASVLALNNEKPRARKWRGLRSQRSSDVELRSSQRGLIRCRMRPDRKTTWRKILSNDASADWRWRPPSTRRTPFASRTNRSPFPPVRITVPLCAAGARARTTRTFRSGVWLFASQWARKIRCPESGKPPNPIGLERKPSAQ
jgi:hypothetical protein